MLVGVLLGGVLSGGVLLQREGVRCSSCSPADDLRDNQEQKLVSRFKGNRINESKYTTYFSIWNKIENVSLIPRRPILILQEKRRTD